MDDDSIQELPPESTGKLSRRSAVMWALIPLLACVACAAITLFALIPESSAVIPIPVSGDSQRMPPTPPPEMFQPPAEQEVPRGSPTMAPGLWYRAEMDRRLENCYASFEAFYLLEQVAFYEPTMIYNEEWRANAGQTAQTFRDDCEQLGSLPQAPNSFNEVDGWLKLAAAEVGPAADSFSQLVDEDDPTALYRLVGHLSNFLEYTRNAESALERLDERKHL